MSTRATAQSEQRPEASATAEAVEHQLQRIFTPEAQFAANDPMIDRLLELWRDSR